MRMDGWMDGWMDAAKVSPRMASKQLTCASLNQEPHNIKGLRAPALMALGVYGSPFRHLSRVECAKHCISVSSLPTETSTLPVPDAGFRI